MTTSRAWAVIAGVGPGTGASVARKFAQSYSVALLARKPANYEPLVEEINKAGGKAVGFSTDVADATNVKASFDKLKSEMGESTLAAAVFNVGGTLVRKPFLELTEDEFTGAFNLQVRGAFLFSQAVLPLLLATKNNAHPPTLIFTGATASNKGSATFASFATGKFAVKALAQSLAREYGPKGIHIGHVIVDGVIDIPRTKAWQFDAPDAKLSPDAIADSYWFLHTQPRTNFTFEFDVRPYVEKW